MEILQNPDIEVCIAVRVRFTDLYVHPTALFPPKKTYKTFLVSFVRSRPEFVSDRAESSAHGTATFCSRGSEKS